MMATLNNSFVELSSKVPTLLQSWNYKYSKCKYCSLSMTKFNTTAECLLAVITLMLPSLVSPVNGWLFFSRDIRKFGSVRIFAMEHFYFEKRQWHYQIVCECQGDKHANWSSIHLRLDMPAIDSCLNISSTAKNIPVDTPSPCVQLQDWASVGLTGHLYSTEKLTLKVEFSSGHKSLSWSDLAALEFRCSCADSGVEYAGWWKHCNPTILGLGFNYELWWHYVLVILVIILVTQVFGLIGFHLENVENRTGQKFSILFFCSPCLFLCTIDWFIRTRLKIYKWQEKRKNTIADSTAFNNRELL